MFVFGVILVRIFPHSDWISLRVQSECRKMRTRIIPNTDAFHAAHNIMFDAKFDAMPIFYYSYWLWRKEVFEVFLLDCVGGDWQLISQNIYYAVNSVCISKHFLIKYVYYWITYTYLMLYCVRIFSIQLHNKL